MTLDEMKELYENCPHTKLWELEMKNIKTDLDEIKKSIVKLETALTGFLVDKNKDNIERDKIISSVQTQIKIQWFFIGGAILLVLGALIKLFVR